MKKLKCFGLIIRPANWVFKKDALREGSLNFLHLSDSGMTQSRIEKRYNFIEFMDSLSSFHHQTPTLILILGLRYQTKNSVTALYSCLVSFFNLFHTNTLKLHPPGKGFNAEAKKRKLNFQNPKGLKPKKNIKSSSPFEPTQD